MDAKQLTWSVTTVHLGAQPGSVPPGYVIRPMTARDRDDLTVVFFAAYDRDTAPDEDAARAEIDVSFAGEYGPLDMSASPVALHHGDIVAAVMTVSDTPWDDTPDGPFIIEVMVDPDHRRRGLATALLVWTGNALHERGAPRVGLRVMDDNDGAVLVYRSLGFA